MVKEYFAEASIANRHLNQTQGPKLYSKVLAIEPNRLL
jgi:hypothetical protein